MQRHDRRLERMYPTESVAALPTIFYFPPCAIVGKASNDKEEEYEQSSEVEGQ
jgi:hypothetical protein